MAEPSFQIVDEDFAAQMNGLVRQATREAEGRAVAAQREDDQREAVAQAQTRAAQAYQSMPQMLRPLVLGLEAMGRAAGEHGQALSRLEAASEKAQADASGAQQLLPQLAAELRAMLDQKNGVTRQMFDALHEELRTYKDGFLLDSVHRPVIRDLISLYDDITEIRRQTEAVVADQQAVARAAGTPEAGGLLGRVESLELHLEHNLEFIVEVLARLEVSILPVAEGKLDKRTQRAVAVEMAEDPDQEGDVVRTAKRGFLWKDRVVRAEEVVIRKWKEGFLVALQPPAAR